MADLRDLYQEVILEHSKQPRNFRELATANRHAEGYNPLCGDHFTVYLNVEGNSIKDIAFQGSGCAISKASASMMTQTLKGKTREEAGKIFHNFHELVTGHRHPTHPSEHDFSFEVKFVAQFSLPLRCQLRGTEYCHPLDFAAIQQLTRKARRLTRKHRVGHESPEKLHNAIADARCDCKSQVRLRGFDLAIQHRKRLGSIERLYVQNLENVIHIKARHIAPLPGQDLHLAESHDFR